MTTEYVALMLKSNECRVWIAGKGLYNLAEVYKAIVLGPPNVGKSSLIRRYQMGEFKDEYTATVGMDMKAATFDFPDGSVVLTVVDIGGQSAFTGLRSRFLLVLTI